MSQAAKQFCFELFVLVPGLMVVGTFGGILAFVIATAH